MKKLLLAGAALCAFGSVAHAVPLQQIEPTGYICEGAIGGSATVFWDVQAGTVYWRVKDHPIHKDHKFSYWVTNAFGHSNGSPPFQVSSAFIGTGDVTGNNIYGVFDMGRRDYNFSITISRDEIFEGRCIGDYKTAVKLKEDNATKLVEPYKAPQEQKFSPKQNGSLSNFDVFFSKSALGPLSPMVK